MSLVETKRRKGESFDSLLRRFTRRVQTSGKLIETRKYRFHAKKPNQTTKRDSALRRIESREQRDYLMKVGKLVEEKRGPKRR
jgi:ribosomal protein S21